MLSSRNIGIISKETIVTIQDRLDCLLILSKTIQDDKENTAMEIIALNEKMSELTRKRAWLRKMEAEIDEISYCVNRLSGMTTSLPVSDF